MALSRIIIIYNPNSTGASQAMAEDLKQILSGRKAAQVELVATQRAGHAEELAYKYATTLDRPLIISSSGDGGYHELINGIMRAKDEGKPAVAAVLPAGNANDHRRTLAQAPLSEGILNENTTEIDLLRFEVTAPNGSRTVRYAHSYIGLGLTPVVATELNRHTLNALREMIIVIRAFYKLQPFTIRVEGREQTFDSLILSNINRMAKALTVAKAGKPDDGLIEITRFPAAGKLSLLFHLLKAATVGLESDERTPTYTFEAVQPMPVQLDGEVVELRAGAEVTVSIASPGLTTIL